MIENTDRKNVYEGNGLNDLWPFTFEISTDDGADIGVYLTNDLGDASDRLTSGYSVDVINKRVKYPDPAGTILPEDWMITLARETPLTQKTSMTTQEFDPKSVEVALDKLTMMVQEAQEVISRALVADITISNKKYSLPAPAPLMAMGWNSDGSGIVNYDNPAIAAAAAKVSEEAAAESEAQAANSALQAGTVVDYEGEEPPILTKPLLKWHKPSVRTIYMRNLADDGWIDFMNSETGAVKEATHAGSADNLANVKTIKFGQLSPANNSDLITLTDYSLPTGKKLTVIVTPNSMFGFYPSNFSKTIQAIGVDASLPLPDWYPRISLYGIISGLNVTIHHSVSAFYTYTDGTTSESVASIGVNYMILEIDE